jgi:hypothetical protein
LSAVVTAPWDVGIFCAALAAELAAGPRDAIVVAPGAEFAIPPASYLEGLGEVLKETEWVQTQTLTMLLRSHSPGTRPVLLKTGAGGVQGYIGQSLLTELRAAHAVVTDLAAVADATREPVETAHRLLYMAESRWWSRAQTSPQEASIGLEYSQRAQAVAQAELDKVRFAGVGSTVITGREGVVSLEIENGAGYPMTVVLRLSGTGLTLPEGEESEVELAPGRTGVRVQVVSADGPHSLVAKLVAGSNTVDEVSHSVRFITVATILPALVAAGLAIGFGVYFLVRWYLRRRRSTSST